MTRRTTLIVLILAVLAVIGAGLWTLRPQAKLVSEPFGAPFVLLDQNGDPITEQAFRGRPTAVFFGFTHCPEVCPTTLFELTGWLHKVDPDGGHIGAYFVSVDPERDTPKVLGDYVSSVSDRIIGITGDPAGVEAMYKSYRVYARKVPTDDGSYTMDHTASVFLLDPGGGFFGTIAYGENPDTAVDKLGRLLNG